MEYRKKPVVIEAFTFEEFLEEGRQWIRKTGMPGQPVAAYPWSFQFRGHPITHESDTCYLIPTLEGTMNFTPNDMLIVGVQGEIYPCKKDIFEATYELAVSSGEAIHISEAGSLLQKVCHGLSKRAGWWQACGIDLTKLINEPQGDWEKLLASALVAQKICLSHSELSEGMEGHRKNRMDDKLPHRKMLEVELADAVIRIFDLAGALNYDLGGAIAEKLEFNQQRPDHKPENRAKEGGKAY